MIFQPVRARSCSGVKSITISYILKYESIGLWMARAGSVGVKCYLPSVAFSFIYTLRQFNVYVKRRRSLMLAIKAGETIKTQRLNQKPPSKINIPICRYDTRVWKLHISTENEKKKKLGKLRNSESRSSVSKFNSKASGSQHFLNLLVHVINGDLYTSSWKAGNRSFSRVIRYYADSFTNYFWFKSF